VAQIMRLVPSSHAASRSETSLREARAYGSLLLPQLPSAFGPKIAGWVVNNRSRSASGMAGRALSLVAMWSAPRIIAVVVEAQKSDPGS